MSTQTKNYREVKAVSNSILTEFENNLRAFKSYWLYNKPFDTKDTSSLQLGSIVDTLITRESDFNKIYNIAQSDSPTPQMIKFCNHISDLLWQDYQKGIKVAVTEEILKKAYKLTEFGRDKYESVKEKYQKIKPYLNEILIARLNGKSLITSEIAEKAKNLAKLLKNNQFTKDVINTKSEDFIDGSPSIEVINQLEIYDEYTAEEGGCSIPIKGQLDLIIINHVEKKIHPYDIKTSIKLNHFVESYVEYRYFRQASYYTWLLKKWAEKRGLGDYEIWPFQFIVVSTAGEGAYCYKVSEVDLNKSVLGGHGIDWKFYKGWKTLLDEICWHIKNDKWDYPKDVYDCNGIRTLEFFIGDTGDMMGNDAKIQLY